MPVKVYAGDRKPPPTERWADQTCEMLNKSNKQWSVEYSYSGSRVVFKATGATDQELLDAVSKRRPGGCYVEICNI